MSNVNYESILGKRLSVDWIDKFSNYRNNSKPHIPNRRSLSELLTTLTELNAIAAAAIMGLRTPKAASGIPTTLYANAQKKFCLMVRSVADESLMACTSFRRSPFMIVMSAVSIAISVPVPIAMPTSACAIAGASLMPSPTIATICFPTATS